MDPSRTKLETLSICATPTLKSRNPTAPVGLNEEGPIIGFGNLVRDHDTHRRIVDYGFR